MVTLDIFLHLYAFLWVHIKKSKFISLLLLLLLLFAIIILRQGLTM
jgi:hypothetical protein